MIWHGDLYIVERKRLRKNDIILIVLILAVSAALLLYLNANKEDGGEIAVSVGDEEVLILPLNEDIDIKLSSEHGLAEGQENFLHIRDAKAYISEANCPDKVCVERGEVFREGETIVCMPHKLVVTVKMGAVSEIDGVSE